MLGGRPATMVAREVLSPRNYLALARSVRRYPRFRENLGRYLLGRGHYPYDCRVRTPAGVVAPTLYSRHDMITVNEIFCREDYGNGKQAAVVVDLGSNIGISALFFLTHNPSARIWLFEPVPENVERLRANLSAYAERWSLTQAAVAPQPGRARFGVEASGRYGGIGLQLERSIEVECAGINEVLAGVLAEHERIDLLKIDTEGTELDIARAIRPELLERVNTIYLEAERRPSPSLSSFRQRFRNQTWQLENRALSS